MSKKQSQKIWYIALILIIIAGAIYAVNPQAYKIFGSSKGVPLFIPGVFITNNSCGVQSSTSGLCQAQNLGSGFGSSITSLSQIQTAAGGTVFLVDLVVNNQAQVATGTIKQVLQAINSQTGQSLASNQNSTNVAFTAKLVNESYLIPYQSTGGQIYLWGYSLRTINYIPPAGPYLGTQCTGAYKSGNYTLNCTGGVGNGYNYGGSYLGNVTAFANACHTQNQNGYLALVGSPASTGFWGFVIGPNKISVSFQCVQPMAIPLTKAVFQPTGTKYLYTNVSITYSNGTGTPLVGYVTNNKISTTLGNRIFANLVGYTFSGSDISGASQPYYVLLNGSMVNGAFQIGSGSNLLYKVMSQQNYIVAQALAYPNTGASTNFTTQEVGAAPSFAGPGNSQNYYVPYTSVLAQLQPNLNTQNQRVLSQVISIQNYSFYSSTPYYYYGSVDGLLIPLYNQSGVNPKLGQVPWEPQVQIIANVSTLSLYIPLSTSAPNITSVSPNPFQITSGTQAQLSVTVKNTGQLTNNYYVIVSCGAIQSGGATNAQSISPGSSQIFTMYVSSAVVTSNQTQSCSAKAYASSNADIQSRPFNFSENLRAVCQPNQYGQIVNGVNCVAFTTYTTTSTIPQISGGPTVCPTGQTIIGGTCTSNTVLIIIGIIIFLVLAYLIFSRKRKGGKKGKSIKLPKEAYYIIGLIVVVAILAYVNLLIYGIVGVVLLGVVYVIIKVGKPSWLR